ncbi:hypothetical protein M5D96_001273, partial [Drosophila gunungcola]
CCALLLISPFCLGYTDEELKADGRRVAEIIRTSQDDDSKINNTQELLDIYRRLYPRVTLEDRDVIDRCLALLLISPSCLGYTDEEREADGRKIAEIIRTSQDDDSKINNTQELLDIYRRLLPGLTPEERANIDELIKEHTDEVIIDGVPSQGGASKYIGKILTPVMKDVASGFFLELGTQLGRLFSW